MASLRKNASDDEGSSDSDFTDIDEDLEGAVNSLDIKEAAADTSIAAPKHASPGSSAQACSDSKAQESSQCSNVSTMKINEGSTAAGDKQNGRGFTEVQSDRQDYIEPPCKPDDMIDESACDSIRKVERSASDGHRDPCTQEGLDPHSVAELGDVEEKHTESDGESSNESHEELTKSSADVNSDLDAPQASADSPEGEDGKQGKQIEPYEVPSFGFHFFCHDDRYVKRGRGEGRGRGRGRGNQLWERGDDMKWGHDGFLELTKNDTAPPRLIGSSHDSHSQFHQDIHRSSPGGERSGRGRSGRGAASGRRGRGRFGGLHATQDSGGLSELPSRQQADPPPSDFGSGAADDQRRSSGRGAAVASSGKGISDPKQSGLDFSAGSHSQIDAYGGAERHGSEQRGHEPGFDFGDVHAAHRGPYPNAEPPGAEPSQGGMDHISEHLQRPTAAMTNARQAPPGRGSSRHSHNTSRSHHDDGQLWHGDRDGLYSGEGSQRGRRSGRGRGRGQGVVRNEHGSPAQRRPTFYGRNVSSAPHARPKVDQAVDDFEHPEPVPETTGSRRYLASRADAAQAESGHSKDPALRAAAVHSAAAEAPTMVPVQSDAHPHSTHFNPNAPTFLPMGEPTGPASAPHMAVPQGGVVQGVPASSAPPSTSMQGGPHAGASGPQSHQLPPQQRYLSPGTAKGVMLRNELHTMMALPQNSVPAMAPGTATYLPGQAYYNPSMGSSTMGPFPPQASGGYASGMPNAQHVAISPAVYSVAPGTHQVPPEMMMQLPYASYMIDPGLVAGSPVPHAPANGQPM